jgi:hypothetical protein
MRSIRAFRKSLFFQNLNFGFLEKLPFRSGVLPSNEHRGDMFDPCLAGRSAESSSNQPVFFQNCAQKDRSNADAKRKKKKVGTLGLKSIR